MFSRMKTFFLEGKTMRMSDEDFRRYLRAEYPHEYKARYEGHYRLPVFGADGMR